MDDKKKCSNVTIKICKYKSKGKYCGNFWENQKRTETNKIVFLLSRKIHKRIKTIRVSMIHK